MDMLNINGLKFKSLVSLKTDQKVNSSDLLSDTIEAAFRIPGYRGIQMDTQSWDKEAASFFAARSARTPENLLNHVQRITHHIQQKNSEGVYGALIDLFIVLKNHGPDLRGRMLKNARPLLKKEQYDNLHQLLNEDASELETLPSVNCSMLCKGFSGSFRLVEKISTISKTEQDNTHSSIEP